MFRPILDKINSRLAGWKTNHLSLAGRAILAQSVLSTAPYFAMQTTLIPDGICNAIDRRVRGFLWGSTYTSRGCHLVRWHMVTRPKDSGGLSLRLAKGINMAFLSKLGWRILTEQDSLWAKVMMHKYMKGKPDIEYMQNMHRASNAWRGILRAKYVLEAGCNRLATNGNSTRFWIDRWICDKPILEMVTNPGLIANVDDKVANLWRGDIGWDRVRLYHLLLQRLIEKLDIFGLDMSMKKHNGYYWNREASGKFSITSTFSLITNRASNVQDLTWKRLWKLKVPNKMVMLLWLVQHKRLMCNAERVRKGIASDDRCSVCHKTTEDVEHVVCRCPRAKEVWRGLLQDEDTRPMQDLPFDN